jgi:hypothetical protein
MDLGHANCTNIVNVITAILLFLTFNLVLNVITNLNLWWLFLIREPGSSVSIVSDY